MNLTFKQLEKEIQLKKLEGCYILHGNSFFILKDSVTQIIELAIEKSFFALNYCEFDGDNLNWDDLQNALETIAFGNSYRLVLIKNLNWLKFNKTEIKNLEQIVKQNSSSTICFITIVTEDFDWNQNKKFNGWLLNWSKYIKIVNCGFNSDYDAFNFFSKFVAKRGCEISRSNFNFLINRTQKNWQLVFNELEKICCYTVSGEISKEIILKNTSLNLSYGAFELANEILNANFKKALNILQNLLDSNYSIFLICGALNSCFIDLYRVSLCLKNGLTDSEIVQYFNYKNCEFKIKNAKKMLVNFNLIKIKQCLVLLCELDWSLKTKNVDNGVLLKKFILEMTQKI